MPVLMQVKGPTTRLSYCAVRIDPSPSLDVQVGLCLSPAFRLSDTLPIVLVAPDALRHWGLVMDPFLCHTGRCTIIDLTQ